VIQQAARNSVKKFEKFGSLRGTKRLTNNQDQDIRKKPDSKLFIERVEMADRS